MPTDTSIKRKKIYEEARLVYAKKYKEELEDLKRKNSILLKENARLQEDNRKLLQEIHSMENANHVQYPQSFLEILSMYERLYNEV